MEPNRRGTVTEYKRGNYYLTVTEWEDGHCEVEVHHCEPEALFHAYEMGQLDSAKALVEKLAAREIPKGMLPESTRVDVVLGRT